MFARRGVEKGVKLRERRCKSNESWKSFLIFLIEYIQIENSYVLDYQLIFITFWYKYGLLIRNKCSILYSPFFVGTELLRRIIPYMEFYFIIH